MGRLFQYNRFGAVESNNKRKKDTQKKPHDKAKMLRNAINCPDYADIYCSTNTMTNAGKNLDLAFNKCQEWSNKLKLQPTTATAATTADEPAVNTQSRTHKVYDSMKNFLQRKLFAQPSQLKCEDEPTSDYDEQDLLDSSYQADAEEDELDGDELLVNCSCSSAEATPKRSSNNKSPQKSLLSLNCWQSSQPSDSSGSEEPTADQPESDDAGISDCCQLLNESSNSNGSGKRRGTPKKRQTPRYNHNTDDEEDAGEEPELLHCAWYQPRITAKAAQEHLQQATPGSFLLRRSTPRNFELCLRLEHKVKCYAVQCNRRSEMYSLKGAKKQFSTLKALITHHSVMAEQLPLTLDMPRERDLVKSSAVRYADDFEPLESLQLLGILKSLQAKNFEA
ncbi:protein sprint isoform X1 [Drosophila sulfurigaster albostrigata]|uniref:protein sprint isoform X1 n=1 Tax=Drosophila sulfurigaster albostrigata TaxID=89887 RepID=UPI002D21E310|nr:protein sprint isoform X1 [Drosophila sulfurigaster albostrigata]